jgi:hypothetical protein
LPRKARKVSFLSLITLTRLSFSAVFFFNNFFYYNLLKVLSFWFFFYNYGSRILSVQLDRIKCRETCARIPSTFRSIYNCKWIKLN